MLHYQSVEALCHEAEQAGCTISRLVLTDQARVLEREEQSLYDQMSARLQIMQESVQAGMDPALRSTSGLSGGDGAKMQRYAQTGGIAGSFLNQAIARTLAASECNAAMGKIVAAPTAGSCGILPGTILSVLAAGQCTQEQAVMSLFTAGGIGMVLGSQATLAGAEGGCQAECGSAAAMAAAALVELRGGTPTQSAHACAMALKNLLGLVCDPVAGLVEVPCIKRNVAGVMVALSAAEMALAGIESRIPADECISAMYQVGAALPTALRETAQGGLAATPTGRRLQKEIFSSEPDERTGT
ncbi:MAG: L-serine ammonia-lyase, iron-sulfur-dependent, subunit alpha [Lawsonibacter sp.]|nr:L-serine ammonia-lyase, iron-sulfur-dependent, subunit alpha [Lawsonibacter sp.]